MIKREYEIEKKKKKQQQQQIKEREWEWLESGWELLSLQIIFFFFLNPQKLLRWLVVIGVISLQNSFTKF